MNGDTKSSKFLDNGLRIRLKEKAIVFCGYTSVAGLTGQMRLKTLPQTITNHKPMLVHKKTPFREREPQIKRNGNPN